MAALPGAGRLRFASAPKLCYASAWTTDPLQTYFFIQATLATALRMASRARWSPAPKIPVNE